MENIQNEKSPAHADEESTDQVFGVGYAEEQAKYLKKKPDTETIVVKGVEYEKLYGKLIRSLDREQAQINENQRRAYFNRRGKELDKFYEKKITKEVSRIVDEVQRNKERAKLEEEYDELAEAQIIKEWKSFGKTDRDWTKYKVVFFDEDGKP